MEEPTKKQYLEINRKGKPASLPIEGHKVKVEDDAGGISDVMMVMVIVAMVMMVTVVMVVMTHCLSTHCCQKGLKWPKQRTPPDSAPWMRSYHTSLWLRGLCTRTPCLSSRLQSCLSQNYSSR